MIPDPPDLDAELERLQRETQRVTAMRHEAAVRAVDTIAAAAKNAGEADDALDRAVRDARATGCTWQQIADAAGMTRQSAWRRWAPEASR